jgi:hypothetical protein
MGEQVNWVEAIERVGFSVVLLVIIVLGMCWALKRMLQWSLEKLDHWGEPVVQRHVKLIDTLQVAINQQEEIQERQTELLERLLQSHSEGHREITRLADSVARLNKGE